MRPMFTGGILVLSLVFHTACGQASAATPQPALTLTAVPATSTASPPPRITTSSSWIEVDLAKQTVLLHEGGAVIAEYPASTGVTSDPKYATPPGLYRVQSKDKGPVESVSGVFVSDVVMFDIRLGNRFHSMPMDAQGNILDATLGMPTTAGCVRVGESARLFEFAQLGMWV